MAGIFGMIGNIDKSEVFKKYHQLIHDYSIDTNQADETAFMGIAGLNFKNIKIFTKDDLIIGIYGNFYLESENISDSAESIYTLYKKYNDDFICKLDGDFNLFIYNKKLKEIKIYNDWAGNHFLFYSVQEENLIFSSDFKAIVKCLKKKTIHNKAIVESVMFAHNLEDKTPVKEIELLPAGSVLSFKKGKIHIRKYFDLKDNYNPVTGENKELLAEKLYDLFEKSTLKHLNKEKVSLPLTGGMDSRFLLHFILKTGFQLNDVFTLGDIKDEDVKIASLISKKYNLPYRSLIPETGSFNELLNDYYIYDGLMVAQLYGFSLKKILEKEIHYIIQYVSSDAMLGGRYTPRTKKWMSASHTPDENLKIILNEFIKANKTIIDSLFLKEFHFYDDIINQLTDTYNFLSTYPSIFSYEYFFLYEHARRMNNIGLYAKYIDRLTPSHDRDLIIFGASLPLKMKYFQYLYKYMFKKYCPDLAGISREGTGIPISWPENLQVLFKFINKKILKKDKFNSRAIFPEKAYREVFFKEIENILLSNRLKERNILNTETIQRILSEHKMKKNRSYLIHQLLKLEMFFRNNID